MNSTAVRVSDVLVIGAGVIGLTTAFRLAQRGRRVTVIDQSQPAREASWAGAGMLPPGNPQANTTPEAKLRGASHALWDSLTAELRELTGLDNGYHREGGLELSLVNSPLDQMRIAREIATWRSEGVAVIPCDPQELREYAPGLNNAQAPEMELGGGYYLPDFGQVRNPRHLKALLAACERLGVTIHSGCPVEQVLGEEDRWHAIEARSEIFRAENFVVATGAWTGSWTRSLGWEIPIIPVRGQMVLLQTRPRLLTKVLNLGPRYVVPRRDGRVLVGSTEEEVGFLKENTAAGVAGLLDLAVQLVPGLASATIEQTWAGLRPGLAGGLPIIGRAPEMRNVYIGAGHFRAGLQLSPITAQLLAEMILGDTTTLDCAPYARGLESGTSETTD